MRARKTRERAECGVILRKERKFFEVKHAGTFNASEKEADFGKSER